MNASPVVSSTHADWSREAVRRMWDPGRKLLKAIRDYQHALRPEARRPVQAKIVVLRHKFWSIVTQCEIDLTCRIGGGAAVTSSYWNYHSPSCRYRGELPDFSSGDPRHRWQDSWCSVHWGGMSILALGPKCWAASPLVTTPGSVPMPWCCAMSLRGQQPLACLPALCDCLCVSLLS